MNQDHARRHARVPFREPAVLHVNAGTTACHAIDISLKGALLELEEAVDAIPGCACTLTLTLGADTCIRMQGHVAHMEGGMRLGICCEDIDLDSITHLRRLIELNLGDAALLDREIAAMISD
jgi:hypothetical protein